MAKIALIILNIFSVSLFSTSYQDLPNQIPLSQISDLYNPDVILVLSIRPVDYERLEEVIRDFWQCHSILPERDLTRTAEERVQELLSSRSFFGATPLKIAIESNNVDVIQALIEAGADIDIKDPNGYTFLMKAAGRWGSEEHLRTLIALGANVDAMDDENETALMKAVSEGNSDIVRILLNAKAAVNVKTKYNETPLMQAAFFGCEEIVRMLLDAGADVNAKSRFGTALNYAERKGHSQVADLLRAYGAKE